VALGAAEADGAGCRLLPLLSAAAAAVASFPSRAARGRDDALRALAGAGADERGDLLPVEARASLVELPQHSERR